jgi:hypothetical protein
MLTSDRGQTTLIELDLSGSGIRMGTLTAASSEEAEDTEKI